MLIRYLISEHLMRKGKKGRKRISIFEKMWYAKEKRI